MELAIPGIARPSRTHETVPTFEVVTKEQLASINLKKLVDPIDKDSAWGCNHCDHNYSTWAKAASVRTHLQKRYAVFLPQEQISNS